MNIFEYVNEQRGYYYSYCGAVGYEPLTTIFADFCFNEAEADSTEKVKELYEAINEQYIKAGPEYSADLAMALNLKCWYFYEAQKAKSPAVEYIGKQSASDLQELYINLFYKFKDKAMNELEDEAVSTFLQIID